MANINELLTAISFAKQADIATAQDATHMWRVTNLNSAMWPQNPITEDDASESGKGHEFATQLFKSHYMPGDYEIRKYLSTEIAALAFGGTLGNVVKSGTGPYTYTITPVLGATNPTGLELPYFTFVQQIRPGGSAVLDQLFKGCAMRSLRLSASSSPGRASAMLSLGLVTTGQYTEPSSITIPAPITLNELNAGLITALTINGIDYFTSAKDFLSFEWAWDNNFLSGFFVGSGAQDGFQTQGRFEVGTRAHGFSYSARFKNGSTELTKLRALTTGTAVITFTKDSGNSLQITEQQLGFRTAVLGESNGIVTVSVTGSEQYHSTNGLVTVVAKCGVDGICQ